MSRPRRPFDVEKDCKKPGLYRDPFSQHLFVRTTPKLCRSFTCVAREPKRLGGKPKQKWITIGRCDVMTIDEAREQSKAIVARIKLGKTPVEPPAPKPDTLRDLAERWLAQKGKGQITIAEKARAFTSISCLLSATACSPTSRRAVTLCACSTGSQPITDQGKPTW